MRRPHALHPTALLVDKDRRIGDADSLAQSLGQGSDLLRALDIALEQDEAPGARVPEKGPLVRGKLESGTADDESARSHRARLDSEFGRVNGGRANYWPR